MQLDDFKQSPRFSDEEVRRILRRAAELERTTAGTSLFDLVQSAKEAGLDGQHVLQAAAETVAERKGDASPHPDSSAPRWQITTLKASTVGILLGLVTAFFEIVVSNNGLVDIPSVLTLVGMGWILFENSPDDSRSPFKQLAGLLLGYGAGWALINKEVPTDFVMALLVCGASSIGLAAIRPFVTRFFKRVA
jgi:hypothetical protein